MKIVAFHFSPKNHTAFGPLLIETMSPRTFKNRPIVSHWMRNMLLLIDLLHLGIKAFSVPIYANVN